MSAKAILRDSLAPLVDLIYPPRCPLCGAAIGAQTGLCSDCWSELRIPSEPACVTCQRPFGHSAAGSGAVCAVCLVKPPRHDGIAAGTLYGHGSRKLVLAFKHGRRIALAPMLARLIVARLPALEGTWLVAPVPLHRWRLWSRGYNQAALLAREVARLTGQTLALDPLIRTKHTATLGGLGRTARARALRGALTVNPRYAAGLKGAQVILVDDVLTSGATSDACVRALKRAGADKVIVACFARVLDETDGEVPENETPGALTPGAP
ncbi:ComF family protein [Parafrankia sp. BMG5.11]|uniref:ComF family protein n=1 Tax=Parafrankia sp. BMG5.11 TaxID=222540 RepID=UPI00103A2F0C|nr:ComF family protein [Parafrankia sp. BMG5.11]TCJ37420.1 ComF family protein [Parafrankia sp. BMG5.11]